MLYRYVYLYIFNIFIRISVESKGGFMDLGRLLALRELARSGTMAAAADALHLTPSAISQQIGLLERDLNIGLTERRGRGVTLTPAGEALVRHTERVMMVLDEAKSELALLRAELTGELRVAAFPSVAVAVLSETVRLIQAKHPRLHIVVQEMEPQEGLTALGTWNTDVALIDDLAADPGVRHDAYDLIPIAQDVMHILLPQSNPLAKRKSLRISDLRDAYWALDSTNSSFGAFVTGLCRRAGFEPKINAHCTGFEMVASMVASGCSVSIASGLRLVKPLSGVAAVRLRPEIHRKIVLAYRRGDREHPAISAFLNEVKKCSERILIQSE
jgi:DNA-binding transcriptional LysR family regulator